MNHLKIVRSSSTSEPHRLSFEQWLVILGRRINKRTVSVGLTATVAITHYGGLFNYNGSTNQKWLLSVTSGIQLVVVFLLVVLTKFTFANSISLRSVQAGRRALQGEAEAPASRQHIHPSESESAEVDTSQLIRRYRNYCMAIWLCWLALYLVFTIQYAPGVSENLKLAAALRVITTFLNNCATLALLCCYLILRRRYTSGSRSPQDSIQTHWGIWGGTLIMLTGVEALCVALAWPGTFQSFLPITPTAVSNGFGWISGISSATILALHTSCLTDKSLGCPTWVFTLLFAYAGLQTGFVELGADNRWVTFSLLTFALLLKTLLYLYLTWAFRYGRLQRFFSKGRDERPSSFIEK